MSCPVKPVLLRVSLSLSPAAARRATRKYSLRAIMMALSPEFNWLDNSDKISPQPAGNLYHGITRAGCLHVDFQGLGEVLRALDASSGAVQISYTSKYCATVFDGDAQTWRGIYSTLGSDEWAQKTYIERWKAVRDAPYDSLDDNSLNRREWLDQQWNHRRNER